MGDGVMDGIDAREIGRIHFVLPARAVLGFLPEQPRQGVENRIKRRYQRQSHRMGSVFKLPANIAIDQRVHDKPRPLGNFSHDARSEEHTSELQSLMRISYAVFCLKKKKKNTKNIRLQPST